MDLAQHKISFNSPGWMDLWFSYRGYIDGF